MSVRTEIAVVGAALALPGVTDLDELRSDLLARNTHFVPVTAAQAQAAGLNEKSLNNENYVAVGAPLDTADMFDRDFFRMTRAEALWSDPQQRLLLQLAHDGLEAAAVDPASDRVGIYATATASSYLRGRVEATDPSLAEVDYRQLLGNDRDFLATRIAYKLGLTGPAISVQSACSSSLVAVHQAILALSFGDTDVAVVAAASLKYPQLTGYIHQAGGILSPTGESRPFDVSSNGTVQGSGAGVVVLRRLDEALNRGDDVLAVIAGTAINNDGSHRIGYSAPSAVGQQDVLEQALTRAGVTPGDVGYIETHGTGTPIGDPIEFRAITRAYGDDTTRSGPCYLGAAKANFGHLDVAAGMVGLIKTILVLKNRTVFGQPSFSSVNPSIPLSQSVFVIPIENVPVPGLRYAAVSSFGMGGTNAHIVLRRADERQQTQEAHGPIVVNVSAPSSEGLTAFKARIADYLCVNNSIDVRDVAATLAARHRHGIQWSTTVDSTETLIEQLNDPTGRPGSISEQSEKPCRTETLVGNRVWLPPTPLRAERYLMPLLHRPTEGQSSQSASTSTTNVAALFQRMVAEELGINEVDADTDFFAAGGESVALVSIVGKLSDTAGFRADFEALDGVTEVGVMAKILAAQASAIHVRSAELHMFGTGTPEVYLYPPAGGTNFCYGALQRQIPERTLGAFRAVRGNHSVETIAAACVRTLIDTEAAIDGMLLGGYSFGGNIAFEIARQLIDHHHLYPGRVLLIDSFAPQAFTGTNGPATDLASEVQRMVSTLADESPALAEERSAILMSTFSTMWLSNTRALATYRPKRTIPTPITLLRADTPLQASHATALGIQRHRVSHWSGWTTGPVDVIDVPGDHYSMFTDASNRANAAAHVEGILNRHRLEGKR
ncbi:hypothetical protein HQO90_12945 [Rhodococcus fascians]|nr:hypothetical protein [Rhodococcus fascians]